jgi:hypothetical protein
MMGAAVLAASVFGSGCSRNPTADEAGSATITAKNFLAYSEISKVEVTVSGANITRPILVPLGHKTNSTDWATTVQGIPAGAVNYAGNAYNAAGAVIFTGQVAGTVTAGQTANVLINLFQATPNAFSNSAPVITALQIATTSATPGQAVDVNVVASDPDAGDTLTYAWTSTCGAVSPANAAHSTWTAPASASAPCKLTVTVTDSHGAQTSATASIAVAASNKGAAAITVAPDLAPIISAINVNVTDATTAAAAFVNGNVAHLQALATDDGATMTYAWTVAGCTGTFGDAALSSTSFTLASDAPAVCTFTVLVTDDKGQPTSGSLVLPVAAAGGTSTAAPIVETYSNSSDTVSAGQEIYFYVSVSQIAHDGITFAWAGNPGSASGYSQTDSNDPALATPSSTVKYIAPADLGDLGQPLVVTVTATDTVNHLTVQHTWNLPKRTAQCAGGSTGTCDDGNACTTGDHCDGLGNCVAGAQTDCSTGMGLCEVAGTCNRATGACVYPAAPAGTSCTDGHACTTNDICNGHSGAGACNGTPVVCTANQCETAGSCQEPSGTCSAATPVTGGTCNDGHNCTTGDTCNNGVCVGTAVTCAAATDVCHVAGTCQEATGTCSAQTVGNQGGSCSDNDPCTTGDVCNNGVCSGSALCQAPLVCNPATATCNNPPAAACMAPAAARDWTVKTTFVGSDGSAGIYAAGTLIGAFDFGAGAGSAGGDSDIYVNKVNPATGLATWTRQLGDASAQLGLGVTASSSAVGVIGNYIGAVTGTSLPANASGTAVDFVLGLNPATGATVWGKKVDLAGGDFAAIASNPSLNAFYVCGNFGIASFPAGSAGPVDLGVATTAFGGKDIVVARVNGTDGSIAWARHVGTTGDDACSAIAIDDAGANVFIAGTYSNGALDLGTGAFPAATASQARIYVARLNAATGATVSASAYGTTGRQIPASLTADVSGNVVLGGSFLTTISFATGMSITAASSASDAFLVKFNANLVPQWAKSWNGGTGSEGAQTIRSVATDAAGNIFATGLFANAISLGTAGALVTSAGGTDAFTAKLDAQGNVLCAATYGDTASQSADSITIARFATGATQNTAMLAGAFAGSITLGSTVLNTGSPATTHGYVTTLSVNSF